MRRTAKIEPRREILLFATQKAWEAWLEKNHAKSQELWLRIAKKGSELRSVSYAEALEAALSYGPESDKAWLQRFVPRSTRSIWSKINREKAEELIANGNMKAAGLAAKKDGRWDSAYDSMRSASASDDFYAALNASPHARDFFMALDSAT